MSKVESIAERPGVSVELGGLPGMSLRDYFAGQALIMAMRNEKWSTTATWAEVARWAYHVADAMLAEREKRDEPTT